MRISIKEIFSLNLSNYLFFPPHLSHLKKDEEIQGGCRFVGKFGFDNLISTSKPNPNV